MDRQSLEPFGVEITSSSAEQCLSTLSPEDLQQSLATDRVVVLRGFSIPNDEVMLDFCRSLGNILEWEFGAINELRVTGDAQNYIYTNGAVPFHWDGAFVGRVPHIIFFHCIQASPAEHGGETEFCNTVELLANASDSDLLERMQSAQVTYSTEKLAHYGGSFQSPLLDRHPVTGEQIIRFAEPVEDLNPVHLEIDGIPEAEQAEFISQMSSQLHDQRWCLTHSWQDGDVVLADNHALLHGRRAFQQAVPRHLRRVNIMATAETSDDNNS